MRLLLAAGGTGGHVIPALVLARQCRRRDPSHQLLFAGTSRGLENRLVPEAGFRLELLQATPLLGQSLPARVQSLVRVPRALWQASRILERFRPSVVLGVGGYAAGPVMLAAAWSGVPLAVLEPNAVPGLANRWVAPYVAGAFLAFPEAASYFPPGKARVWGLPVRPEFFSVPPKRHQPPFTILIFGGSQGSRTLNRAVLEALPQLAPWRQELLLLHQTGQNEYNAVREAYASGPVPAEIAPYMENMPEAFARADLVVCRAGAATVAELAAAGRAAILVPFPSATHQHQLRNAEALARRGAATLILDRDMNGPRLFDAIRELLDAPERLSQMEAAIRPMAQPEAASRIVEELVRLGGPPAA